MLHLLNITLQAVLLFRAFICPFFFLFLWLRNLYAHLFLWIHHVWVRGEANTLLYYITLNFQRCQSTAMRFTSHICNASCSLFSLDCFTISSFFKVFFFSQFQFSSAVWKQVANKWKTKRHDLGANRQANRRASNRKERCINNIPQYVGRIIA